MSYIAAWENNVAIVHTLLLQSQIDVNRMVNGENALLAAVTRGHKEVVRRLLEQSDIDTSIGKRQNAGDALFIASEIGHSEIVKDLLIQPQINVNKRFRIEKMTAIEIATHNGHVNIVKLLMRCPKTQIDNDKMDAFDTLYTSVSSIRNTLLKSRHTCCLNANEVLLKAVINNDPRAIKGL